MTSAFLDAVLQSCGRCGGQSGKFQAEKLVMSVVLGPGAAVIGNGNPDGNPASLSLAGDLGHLAKHRVGRHQFIGAIGPLDVRDVAMTIEQQPPDVSAETVVDAANAHIRVGAVAVVRDRPEAVPDPAQVDCETQAVIRLDYFPVVRLRTGTHRDQTTSCEK
jgi:hypothetical protein